MKLNNSTRWSIGLWVVAMQKNDRVHKTLNTSPYQLLYGQIPRVKATTLPWDKRLLSDLQTEVQLEKLLGSKMIHEEHKVDEEEELSEEDDDEDDEEEVEDMDEEDLPPGLRPSIVLTTSTVNDHEDEMDNNIILNQIPVVDISMENSGILFNSLFLYRI